MCAEKWNAELYDSKHSFVWEKAEGVLELLGAKPGERILDLGCGTGSLTAEISAKGAEVLGVDQSAEMIAEARKKFLELRFEVCDARSLPFSREFDAVFSNAALHWIPEAERVVQGIARALRPNGRFVAEFGGRGNVNHVVTALETALTQFAISPAGANPWFFPSVEEYTSLLEKHGIKVRQAVLFDRPTRLEDGERGLAVWVTMFGASFLNCVPEPHRPQFLQAVEQAARPSLWNTDHWEMDYRRLRVAAWKPLS
jgi:trans-aconitate methyltransferase